MKVCIDPDMGGCTIVSGGHPPTILAAGYVGSTIFGGLFIMAGFDTLVSKIMSFVLGVGLIAPLALVRNKLYVYLPLRPHTVLASSPDIVSWMLVFFHAGVNFASWLYLDGHPITAHPYTHCLFALRCPGTAQSS